MIRASDPSTPDRSITTPSPVESELEPMPPAAALLFAEHLPLAQRFVDLLVSSGIERGLVGPREAGRIWSRHVLNCAVLGELLPPDSRIVDVGSGAGLPGLAVALARPDVTVDLVEPLLRRTTFLTEAVEVLGLTARVRVVRGRAEDAAVRAAVGDAAIVTARAVAPLDRLATWCLPLLAPDGVLLALKGATAAEEVTEHLSALARLGVREIDVVDCGSEFLQPPTAVIRIRRGSARRATTKGRR